MMASLVAQRIKRLPAMQETQARSLGWEDPLEKEMATHSSILAWRIPWTEEPDGLRSMGSQRVGHDWATSLHFHSAYKLNKQGDSIQSWHTPSPIWNQSVVPCPVLTVASWPAYRFLKRQGRWSGIPISFRIFHSLLWSTQSNAVNKDVFLELSCFFHDPADVGNLISGSSAFSKTILNMWKFMVHILLKPGLENFEH